MKLNSILGLWYNQWEDWSVSQITPTIICYHTCNSDDNQPGRYVMFDWDFFSILFFFILIVVEFYHYVLYISFISEKPQHMEYLSYLCLYVDYWEVYEKCNGWRLHKLKVHSVDSFISTLNLLLFISSFLSPSLFFHLFSFWSYLITNY